MLASGSNKHTNDSRKKEKPSTQQWEEKEYSLCYILLSRCINYIVVWSCFSLTACQGDAREKVATTSLPQSRWLVRMSEIERSARFPLRTQPAYKNSSCYHLISGKITDSRVKWDVKILSFSLFRCLMGVCLH